MPLYSALSVNPCKPSISLLRISVRDTPDMGNKHLAIVGQGDRTLETDRVGGGRHAMKLL